MKILVTGFEPFGGESLNPSWEIVKNLPDQLEGVALVKKQLPTAFAASSRILLESLEQEKPDMVLSVGQAGGRSELTLERVAINIDDARIPDNEEAQPIDLPIQKEGQPAYFTSLPVKAAILALQEAGLPASLSNTAGTYVCNHVMYEALHYAHKHQLPLKAGFMHIPYAIEQVVDKPNTAAMPLEEMAKGLRLVLKTFIHYADQADLSVALGKTE